MASCVLVTDFDGTITANEYYLLAAERLLPSDGLAPWHAYQAGRISHFAAMQSIFGSLKAPEEKHLELVADMRPDPRLAASAAALRAAGWEVVVASAGCDWYINRVLDLAGVKFTVYANPCRLEAGALRMSAPVDSPFYSPEAGIDKAGIVRHYLQAGARVAYAGDGLTDKPAALLAPPERRFARGALAQSLRQDGEGFQPFAAWSEAVDVLLAGLPCR